MKVLLLHLDGKTPNLALMKIASYHKSMGDSVELRWATTAEKVRPMFWDNFDRVYASTIFERTKPVVDRLLESRPDAIVGGTGWDITKTLASVGIPESAPDYSVYPKYKNSIGFTQRGCRLKCSFCVVPRKEGRVQPVSSIWDIWRGDPWPRNVLLLDNDFFGQPEWQKRIDEMKEGGFRVSFNQGFNVRLINEEQAAAIASVDYYDDQFKTRRLYTAWDNRRDEGLLFKNLEALVRHGVKADHIMVYMLIGYDHPTKSANTSLTEDDFYRHKRLREFGCRPYPMPFVRSKELVGFQRWIVGGSYDKRISWDDWKHAAYEPRRLRKASPMLF
jgi:hypothetical protein